jgi:hypothetical protein
VRGFEARIAPLNGLSNSEPRPATGKRRWKPPVDARKRCGRAANSETHAHTRARRRLAPAALRASGAKLFSLQIVGDDFVERRSFWAGDLDDGTSRARA